MIQVILSDEEKKQWQGYVYQHPYATFFHLIEWRDILKKAYGYEPFYMVSTQASKIVGVLPLFLVKSFIRGRNLTSLPFHFLGGPIGDTPEIEQDLINKAMDLTKDLECHDLRIKSYHSYPEPLQLNQSYLSFKVPLKKGFDETTQSFSKNIRRDLRLGLRDNKIETVKDESGLKSFYNLFLKSNGQIGIPPHAFILFKELRETFGPKQMVRITLANHKGVYIAGHVALNFKECVLYMWGALDKKYKSKLGIQALQAETIEWAIKNRYKYYDLGWTNPYEAGALGYKKRFGAEEGSVHFYSLTSSYKLDYHHSFPLVKAIWRRLPLRVIKTLSPFLAKHAG
jgi:hypothetical protein